MNLSAQKINSTKNIAYSELGLANILSKQGEKQKAIDLLEKALSSIESMNDIGINSEIYKALSENYSAIGDTENFNKYTSLYSTEQEKLLSEEKKSLNKVANDLSIENIEKQREQKNKYLYLFLFSGCVLGFVLYFSIKKILSKKRKIALHKKEIDKTTKDEK